MINNRIEFLKAFENLTKSDTNPVYSKLTKSGDFNVITTDSLDRTTHGNFITVQGKYILVTFSDFEEFNERCHKILAYGDGKLITGEDFSFFVENGVPYISVKHNNISNELLIEIHKTENNWLEEEYSAAAPFIKTIQLQENAIPEDGSEVTILKKKINWIRSLEDILVLERTEDGIVPFYDFSIKYDGHSNVELLAKLNGILITMGFPTIPGSNPPVVVPTNDIPYDFFHNIEKYVRVKYPSDFDDIFKQLFNDYYSDAVIKINRINITKDLVILNKNATYYVDEIVTSKSIKINNNLEYRLPKLSNFTRASDIEVYVDGEYIIPNIGFTFDMLAQTLVFKTSVLGSRLVVVKTINTIKGKSFNDPELTSDDQFDIIYSNHELHGSGTDYVFNIYGIFVIHSPFPVTNSKSVRVFNNGIRIPSENITFIRNNLIHISGLVSNKDISIKSYRAHNEIYAQERLHIDPSSSYTGTYGDNVDLERPSNIVLEMLSEWIKSRYLESVGDDMYFPSSPGQVDFIKKMVGEYRTIEGVSASVWASMFVASRGINTIPNLVRPSAFKIVDPNLRKSIINELNYILTNKNQDMIDPNINLVDFNGLNNILMVKNLDLSDYRIKSVIGLDNIDYDSIFNGLTENRSLNLNYNEIRSINYNIFKELPTYYTNLNDYNMSNVGGNTLKIQLSSNPLDNTTLYWLRKKYIELGKLVEFDDGMVVFPDVNFRKLNNKHVMGSLKYSTKLNHNGLIYNLHRFIPLSVYDNNTTINARIDPWDSTRNIVDIDATDIVDDKIIDITGIDECVNTKAINLSDQMITELPESWENLHKLEYLNLNNNKISDLSNIEGVDTLKYLFVANNGASSISFHNMSMLEYVDVSGNDQGTGSPSNVEELQYFNKNGIIKELNISNTNIRNLTEMFDFNKNNFITLTSFICDGNELDDSGISHVPYELDISNPRDFHTLKYLSLQNNNISDTSFINKLTGITHLYLNNNPLNSTFATYASSFVEIDISNSDVESLENVPDTIISKHLKTFKASNTNISTVSDISVMWDVEIIEVFDVSFCVIPNISEGEILYAFSKSTKIDLRGNPLNTASQVLLKSMVDDGWDILFDRDKLLTVHTARTGLVIANRGPVQTLQPRTLTVPMTRRDEIIVTEEYDDSNNTLQILDSNEYRSEHISAYVVDTYDHVITETIGVNISNQTYYNIGEIIDISSMFPYIVSGMSTSLRVTLSSYPVNVEIGMGTDISHIMNPKHFAVKNPSTNASASWELWSPMPVEDATPDPITLDLSSSMLILGGSTLTIDLRQIILDLKL